MKELLIGDIHVSFPFSPYEVQLTYMEKVIESLRSGSTGFLESPTGTGKTLCLLCAALAWVQYEKSQSSNAPSGILGGKEGRPQVIYCSRTHSQLSQVIQEMKRSPYRTMKGALLGSKEHFCVHREVSQLSHSELRNHACKSLRCENGCRYFSALQNPTKCSTFQPEEILDMEDLVLCGKKKGFCPYYLERELALEADIIFMPYNYVIDPALRKQLPFRFEKNCTLIIDEAHNIPSVLSADGCTNMTALSLASAIQDCSRGIAMLSLEHDESFAAAKEVKIRENDVAALKIVLKRLEDLVLSVNLHENASRDSFLPTASGEIVHEGPYMYTFLEKALITREVYFGCEEALGMNNVITETIQILQKSDKCSKGLVAVYSFLETVFSVSETDDLSSVKFIIQEQQMPHSKTEMTSNSRVLGFWRLDSSELCRIQEAVHALILTSGTLSPIDHFAAELNIKCDIQLKGSHVIDKQQLMASILCKGPSGEKLNGSFACRSSSDYLFALGMTLQNLSRHVPGGTLVFFPSYASLYSTVDFWRNGRKENNKTVWAQLTERRPVFIEPNDNSELAAVVQKFKENAEKRSGGAILLAVCRGKVSEGVNFSDEHGRCILVTGIPYANCADLFVRLKRKYLTVVASRRPKIQGRLFTGEDWYRTEAMRAVSQCVGRAIRHKTDYGALVLADERFKDLATCLPEWILPSLSVGLHFRETFANVVTFFRLHEPSGFSTDNTDAVFVDVTEKATAAFKHPDKSEDNLLEKAREYTKNQHRVLYDAAECRKRIRLEEAQELPCTTQKIPLVFSPKSLTVEKTVSLSHAQELPSTLNSSSEHFSPVGSLQILPASSMGSSSRDFCIFLKNVLKPELYKMFKDALEEISILHRQRNHGALSCFQSELATVVQKLATVFETVQLYDVEALMLKFGSYIPKDFYFYYLKEVQRIEKCKGIEK